MTTITRKEFVLTLAGTALATAQTLRPKVLLVFAHPDDESVVASTVYRLTHELGAQVDHVVITNGEGGFKYSKLAESLYGAALTDESTGRSRLPQIRREETLRAGRILGIRRHYFLDQRDARFTLDTNEALDHLWDTRSINEKLESLLREEHYTTVITLLPEPSTHGHHKAAALLLQQAVVKLPAAGRPTILGGANTGDSAHFTVSRSAKLPDDKSLNYSIVVNWVIAEHKSQGLLQRDCNRYEREFFTILDSGSPAAAGATHDVFLHLNAGPKS